MQQIEVLMLRRISFSMLQRLKHENELLITGIEGGRWHGGAGEAEEAVPPENGRHRVFFVQMHTSVVP
jgi:hypothetical protein